jgi:hypothetical protein
MATPDGVTSKDAIPGTVGVGVVDVLTASVPSVVWRSGGGSGVQMLTGGSPRANSESRNSDDSKRSRDLNAAHHIIDIQEDLGMNYPEEGVDKINCILECEERDRREKQDWEEEQGF